MVAEGVRTPALSFDFENIDVVEGFVVRGAVVAAFLLRRDQDDRNNLFKPDATVGCRGDTCIGIIFIFFLLPLIPQSISTLCPSTTKIRGGEL